MSKLGLIRNLSFAVFLGAASVSAPVVLHATECESMIYNFCLWGPGQGGGTDYACYEPITCQFMSGCCWEVCQEDNEDVDYFSCDGGGGYVYGNCTCTQS
jgi:hypothetical protein